MDVLNMQEVNDEDVNKFLTRVMEIEEEFAFAKGGQDTPRKNKLRALLDEFCE